MSALDLHMHMGVSSRYSPSCGKLSRFHQLSARHSPLPMYAFLKEVGRQSYLWCYSSLPWILLSSYWLSDTFIPPRLENQMRLASRLVASSVCWRPSWLGIMRLLVSRTAATGQFLALLRRYTDGSPCADDVLLVSS